MLRIVEEDLHILVMAPWSNYLYNDAAWNIGPALIPAARLAADQINQRSDLLQGYTLRLLERESGCKLTSKTLINFVEAEFYNSNGKGVVGMVGPGCSESVTVTAHQINQSVLDFMQVSISFSPDINGREYINSFRTVPPASVYVDAYASLMEAADWKKVGVVYDNQNGAYRGVFSEMQRRIDSTLIYPVELSARLDHRHAFRKADENNIRILFVLTGLHRAQWILCEKSNYANFQLIFMDLVQEDLLNLEIFPTSEAFPCNSEELDMALNNTIFITNHYRRKDAKSNNTFAGTSYHMYENLYHLYLDKYLKEKHLEKENLPSSSVRYFNAYYDAIWALAIALNNSGTKFNLTDLSYHHTDKQRRIEIGNHVRNNLQKDIHFEGMSGIIHFDKTSRAIPNLGVVLNQTILRSAGRRWEYYTGIFINDSSVLSEMFTFLPYKLKTIAYHVDERLAFTVLIIAALAVAGFAILQVTFLSLKMKSSSPQLNYLILSGCSLYFVALLLYTIQTAFPNRLHSYQLVLGIGCNLQVWCFSVAFTLIFATICAKTWRIYRIFKYFKQGRVKYVSDPFLITTIVCLVLLDLGFLVAWTLSDPWMLAKWVKRDGAQLVNYHYCSCNNIVYWTVGLMTQKLFVILLAIVLSVLVRPVKRRGFKNTKSILILIYSLIIIHVVGISIYILFENFQTLYVLNFLGYALTFALTLVTITLSQFLTHLWPFITRRMRQRRKCVTVLRRLIDSARNFSVDF